MKTFEEIMTAARNTQALDADFAAHLRNLLSEGGVLLQLLGMILEVRDGLAESLTKIDLVDDTGRIRAIKAQGMVQGIDQILAITYNAAAQEKQDVPVEPVP